MNPSVWDLRKDMFLATFAGVVGSDFIADHDFGMAREEGPKRYRYLRRMGLWKVLKYAREESDIGPEYHDVISPITPEELPPPPRKA